MNKRSLHTLLPVSVLVCGSLGLIEYLSTRDAHAATAGTAPTIHCSLPGSCADVRNAGSGVAINAAAANNTGVRVATSAANAPYATVNGVSFGLTGAIVGNDVAASPSTDSNSGVLGFSNNAVGMQGVTFNACSCGSGTDVTTFASNPAVFGLDAGPNNGLAGAGNAGVVGRCAR